MSGLDKVRSGFALVRAAVHGPRLAAENAQLRRELTEARARVWRLEDAQAYWWPQASAKPAWPVLDVDDGGRGAGR